MKWKPDDEDDVCSDGSGRRGPGEWRQLSNVFPMKRNSSTHNNYSRWVSAVLCQCVDEWIRGWLGSPDGCCFIEQLKWNSSAILTSSIFLRFCCLYPTIPHSIHYFIESFTHHLSQTGITYLFMSIRDALL